MTIVRIDVIPGLAPYSDEAGVEECSFNIGDEMARGEKITAILPARHHDVTFWEVRLSDGKVLCWVPAAAAVAWHGAKP